MLNVTFTALSSIMQCKMLKQKHHNNTEILVHYKYIKKKSVASFDKYTFKSQITTQKLAEIYT